MYFLLLMFLQIIASLFVLSVGIIAIVSIQPTNPVLVFLGAFFICVGIFGMISTLLCIYKKYIVMKSDEDNSNKDEHTSVTISEQDRSTNPDNL